MFAKVLGSLAALTMITFPPICAADLPTIAAQELKKLIEGNADIVIVDAQVKGAYDAGHIPGAINIPWEKELRTPGSLTRTKPVIVYCACGQDEKSSDMVGQLMSKFGYENTKVLAGGWYKWLELNYPQEKTVKK